MIVTLDFTKPFDLALSLKAAASFAPGRIEDTAKLRLAIWLDGAPRPVEISQTTRPQAIRAITTGSRGRGRLKAIAERVISSDLDLKPFYRHVAHHRLLGPIARDLRGLKPLRPASLFEMAIIAITEQQISLPASHHIRSRLIERFGERVDGLYAFPTPETLARAPKRQLLACGLSHRKAEYVSELSRSVAEGKLDLERLRTMSDEEARATIVQQRGFGDWSADYILVRGLGRPDCVPVDDLGIRRVVGMYLGRGHRLSPHGVRRSLAPLVPFRGIAVFYLLVHYRLTHAAPPAARAD
jgi:DNA-3-methyladenine glycosylase II